MRIRGKSCRIIVVSGRATVGQSRPHSSIDGATRDDYVVSNWLDGNMLLAKSKQIYIKYAFLYWHEK
jgi:hypothetical protein